MPTAVIGESRTVVDQVRWETYLALVGDRPGNVPQITYDRGLMELMSPRKLHEKIKSLISRMVATYSEVSGIEIESVASTTFQRADLERGFEADEAYYIEHANLMRAKDEIDLAVDPAPDLVIEVEITSSAVRKLELFAAMKVGEVWRYNGDQLTIFHLVGDRYQPSDHSLALPGFPVPAAEHVLSQRLIRGESELISEFRSTLEAVEPEA